MASPRSPGMASPWSIPQHDIDHNGYINSPSAGDASFDSSHSRQRRGSSPGKRALNWFTRSRSGSPQIDAAPHSPTSFVVKNVTKQPGGVSHGQHNDDYHQVRSQPLTASLGVPPGGPGGGIGYGTAKSSNDGRPEVEEARGRSRSPTRPTRPPSPGAITAGAFRSGRVSPGPQSWTQARTEEEQLRRNSSGRSPIQNYLAQQATSPSGPRSGPFSHQQQHSTSPLAGSVLAPSLSTVSVNGNEPSSRFSMPVNLRPGSGPPPIIPLEGVPSPIDIPPSPAPAGITPLGSVSPGGSPGHFLGHRDESAKASPGSPNLASRWMKGLFGKSPRTEERADGMYSGDSFEGQWMKQGTSPSAPYASKRLHNAWTDGSPLGNSTLRDEQEAQERKRQSMHMAAKIEDQHRDQLMKTRSAEAGKEWKPKQAVPVEEDELDWDPPQSKSPPGRKPVPRYSVQELQGMSQEQREVVASRVDPDDRLGKLEGRLTPAQQIIADTRSKQNAKEQSQSQASHVQRGFNAPSLPAKSTTESLHREQQQKDDAPVRRNSKRASPVKAAGVAAPPIRQAAPRPSAPGLSAGNGPLPKEMAMKDALQDMMVRFYRFERFAVPLMRSLEARIVDVERDNQMALHGDAMSANSVRDREMDKWVGQMTGLMKHEIGQLKMATREIREGREILAECAKRQSDQRNSGQVKQGGPESFSSTQVGVGKQVQAESKQTVADMKAREAEHNRKTNFSSAMFNSAVPTKLSLDIAGKKADQEAAREATATNSSPNGRMRYTSVLGQPMHRGKISPAVSPTKEKEAPVMASSPEPSNQSAARRMQSLDDRLKALVVDKIRSPSITSASTGASSQSVQGEDEEAEESDNTSFEKVPSHKIKDDYQVVMARGQSQASARSASGTSSGEGGKAIGSLHLQTPSAATSARTEATIKKPIHQSSRSSSSNGDVGRGGSDNKYLTSPSTTPSRRQPSSSPTPVTTSAFASSNLRARAQSYLLSADGAGSSSVGSSTPSSPTPSPRIVDSPPLHQQHHQQVKPLQVHRGNTVDLLGSNAPTLKASSNPSSNNTPVRPSIRDRVAFFDAAR